MYIKAFLNKDERGCDYSKHFIDHWINNDKLHPGVKSIPVEVKYFDLGAPMVILYDEKGETIVGMVENGIRPDLLQELILKRLE